MILDALLKTKSRVVLMDILNKNGSVSTVLFRGMEIWFSIMSRMNEFILCILLFALVNEYFCVLGLRMLHNIMKQYRRDFKKIPILRKLLKVLALDSLLTAFRVLQSNSV